MFKKLFPILCSLLWITSSQAAPVTWTLEGVTFEDGGVATGSFIFNTNNNSVIDWNVSVIAGDESVFPVFNYTPATVQEVGIFDTGAGGQSFVFFVDPFAPGTTPESRLLALVTDAPLTNAGGEVSLLEQVFGGGNIWESVECYNCSPFRRILGGSLIGSPSVIPTPLPGGIQLYGTSTGAGTGGGTGGSGGPGSGTGGGNFSQFHRIDINTGIATEVSMDIGYGGDVGGLAADANNQLYAGTGGRGPNSLGRSVSPTLLFTIDPVTGLGDPAIGPLGIEFGPPDSAGEGPGAGDFQQFGSRRQNISGWSFDPISGNLYGMAGRGSQLFIADTNTGVATRVGTPCDSPEIGAPGGFCRRGNAIAFDDVGVHNPLGTLFWANDVEVAELDPASGLIIGVPRLLDYTPFGVPNGSAPFRVVAMDVHPLTGDLYAAVQQGQFEDNPPPKSTLAILDPETGTFTIVGAIDSTGVKLDGIAFLPPPSLNNPPLANAGPDQLLECAAPDGTDVLLDGTGSSDAEMDVLTYLWSAAGVVFDDATSPTPSGIFPKGSTTVNLTVSDGKFSDSDEVVITVEDTTPPEINVSLNPNMLWPPNHKMVGINATVDITDSCDANPSWLLSSVISDEPDNGKGDGNTVNDIQNAGLGTPDSQFDMRAERSSQGDGRTYTAEYTAQDADGNVVSESATVVVPHDQGN